MPRHSEATKKKISDSLKKHHSIRAKRKKKTKLYGHQAPKRSKLSGLPK